MLKELTIEVETVGDYPRMRGILIDIDFLNSVATIEIDLGWAKDYQRIPMQYIHLRPEDIDRLRPEFPVNF